MTTNVYLFGALGSFLGFLRTGFFRLTALDEAPRPGFEVCKFVKIVHHG